MQKPDTNAAANFAKNTSADILNAIVNDDATSSKLDALPEVKADDISTLHMFGNILNNNPDLQNEFANALINRIALTLIKSKYFSNPYRMFKRGILEQGDVIEEIYVDLVMPHQYNPEVAQYKWMEREKPTILTKYYRINSQTFYKVTVSPQELNRAFISWNGVTDLVARIVGRLADSLEYDEFMLFKYLISWHILRGHFYPVQMTGTDLTQNIAQIKGMSNAILFPSTEYNPAGVLTHTERDEQYLFMSAQGAAQYDVEVLASAFNMDKAEYLGHSVLYDDLTKYDYARMQVLVPGIQPFTAEEEQYLQQIKAVMVDVDAFMIFDQLLEARQAENGEGLYWNHWLHSWKAYDMSPFHNQIVFVESLGSVSAISITPSTYAGIRGKSVFFAVDATLTGIANAGADWSIDSTVSKITSDGVLQIAPSEPATTITVTATSKADSSVTATATVTLPALGS